MTINLAKPVNSMPKDSESANNFVGVEEQRAKVVSHFVCAFDCNSDKNPTDKDKDICVTSEVP
ncbi:hypothetical protein CR513_38210, partial [Mucuna pruriens]